jgi:glycosyltransferase involved in cell wall biosynthesis
MAEVAAADRLRIMRVAIVIPAFNEHRSIAEVVASALPFANEVIVVDDGSTDRTAEIATQAGAFVVRFPQNRGVGAAVACGLATARDRGADVAVQVDGDGQHVAGGVPRLVAQVVDGANLVIGTRFETGFSMGRIRRTVTKFFAWAVAQQVGRPISDPTSGFRAFDRRAMDALLPTFPRQYLSDTVEVLLIAAELDLEIRTVPVEMVQRSAGVASAGPLRSAGLAVRMLAIIARHASPLHRKR